jgi:uncharacterized tellurite resistance protein B-like protein
MSNRHVQFGDGSRQMALLETMLLAAAADGSVSKVEVEDIYRRVFERPEFEGIHAGDLREAIAQAAQRVAEAHHLQQIVPSLAERLPDADSRALAFALAASVVVADHRTPPKELEVLKALQQAFGLTDAQVASLFEAAEGSAQIPVPPTPI